MAAGSKLSLFSASSVDLLAGGTGSGVSTISSDMRTALTEQGFSVNESLWKFYSDNHSTYTRGGGAIMYGGAEDWSINEAPISAIPQEAKDEAVGTTPVFFIARTGGEGRDLGRYMGDWTDIAEDKDKHYLEPDSVELGVIQYLNDNFDNVILVVNTNNAFELAGSRTTRTSPPSCGPPAPAATPAAPSPTCSAATSPPPATWWTPSPTTPSPLPPCRTWAT